MSLWNVFRLPIEVVSRVSLDSNSDTLSVECEMRNIGDSLTLSPPIPLRLYTLPYWSNPPFLISDIRALWRSGLSARAPECQKLKMVG